MPSSIKVLLFRHFLGHVMPVLYPLFVVLLAVQATGADRLVDEASSAPLSTIADTAIAWAPLTVCIIAATIRAVIAVKFGAPLAAYLFVIAISPALYTFMFVPLVIGLCLSAFKKDAKWIPTNKNRDCRKWCDGRVWDAAKTFGCAISGSIFISVVWLVGDDGVDRFYGVWITIGLFSPLLLLVLNHKIPDGNLARRCLVAK